jgi:hypothetical protein
MPFSHYVESFQSLLLYHILIASVRSTERCIVYASGGCNLRSEFRCRFEARVPHTRISAAETPRGLWSVTNEAVQLWLFTLPNRPATVNVVPPVYKWGNVSSSLQRKLYEWSLKRTAVSTHFCSVASQQTIVLLQETRSSVVWPCSVSPVPCAFKFQPNRRWVKLGLSPYAKGTEGDCFRTKSLWEYVDPGKGEVTDNGESYRKQNLITDKRTVCQTSY